MGYTTYRGSFFGVMTGRRSSFVCQGDLEGEGGVRRTPTELAQAFPLDDGQGCAFPPAAANRETVRDNTLTEYDFWVVGQEARRRINYDFTLQSRM